MYIKIEPNPDGSHAYQVGGNLEDGWAVIPEGMTLPKSFPFVQITTELVTHPLESFIDPSGKETVLSPEFSQLEVTAIASGAEIPLPEEPETSTLETRVKKLEQSQSSILDTLSTILSKITERT